MQNRSLARRLARLEEQITPETHRRVWRIVYVNSDDSKTEGETIEWQAPEVEVGS